MKQLKSDAAVIGYGTVGKATADAYGIYNYYDLKGSNITLEEASKLRFVFICLPTPIKDGRCYTRDIDAIVRQIRGYGTNPILVLRSTVIPGTTANLREKYGVEIVHLPEFGCAKTASRDAREPAVIVVGGAGNKQVRNAVVGLHEGANCPIIETDSTTSETIKYAYNCWFTTKVVFANQIYDICQRSGADYQKVKEAFEAHPWIGENHWEIYHDGYRGAKGACLPKDTEAFNSYQPFPLLKKVIQLNREYWHKK